MKKELGRFLWMAIILIIWGVICYFVFGVGKTTYEIKTVEFEPLDAQMVQNAKKVDTRTIMNELVRETKNVKENEEKSFTIDEVTLLKTIAMAEAEGEGVEGKAAVMAVVINRKMDKRFPDTIEDVIFQKYNGHYQFSPIADGRYYEVVPDVECNLALAEIEMGLWSNFDALYFENSNKSWQADNCEYVQTIGHHRFYKN